MPLFEQFPYTNFHDLNLDRILHAMENLKKEVEQYLTYATITYADPIQWSITTQYQKNTVVIAADGTAYLSTQPVPEGIAITDENYWVPIGNFNKLWDSLKDSICSVDLGNSTTATQNIPAETLFFQQNVLKRALVDIINGSLITADNAATVTVEELLRQMDLYLESQTEIIKDSICEDDQGDSNIATQDYSAGDLFYMDQKLYKAKTAISEGSAITANNAEVTTVENELKGFVPKDPEALQFGTVAPVYQGDWICSTHYLPSAVAMKNGKFYALDSTTDTTNIGTLRVFDPATNTAELESNKSIVMGHGNSMTYDPVRDVFWIVPGLVYDSGTGAHTRTIYRYTGDFGSKEDISTPSFPRGVAYDHKTDSLYYVDTDYKFYKWNGTEFELYSAVDMSEVGTTIIGGSTNIYNQDLAIYDSRFYMSSPWGNVLSGKITANASKIDSSFIVDTVDYFGKWWTGELEGWDFDADGHLWAVKYSNIHSNYRNGFIVEIPTSQQSCYIQGSGNFSTVNFTFTIDSDMSRVFNLTTAKIRSLNQLNNMRWSPATITIATVFTDPCADIGLHQNLELRFNSGGELIISTLTAHAMILNLLFNGGKMTFTTSGSSLILAQRGGMVQFAGAGPVTISTPNRTSASFLVNALTQGATLTAIATAPTNEQGYNMLINSLNVVAAVGLYMGYTKIG